MLKKTRRPRYERKKQEEGLPPNAIIRLENPNCDWIPVPLSLLQAGERDAAIVVGGFVRSLMRHNKTYDKFLKVIEEVFTDEEHPPIIHMLD